MNKKKITNIILRLLMLASFGMFIWLSIAATSKRNNEVVTGVTVNIDESQGNFFISEEQVKTIIGKLLGHEPRQLTGKDLELVEKKLSALPYVLEVRAYVDNANRLTVNISQRVPILRVIPEAGHSYYIDENGYKFPTNPIYTARVPIVTGFVPENNRVTGKIISGNLQRVFHIVKYVNRDDFWAAQFCQYDLTSKGEVHVIPRLGDHIILLGDEKDLKGKLRRLDIFYNEVLPNTGWEAYKVVNVQFNNQIICQKNKNNAV